MNTFSINYRIYKKCEKNEFGFDRHFSKKDIYKYQKTKRDVRECQEN